jgi:hypothetical protein
MKSLSQIIETAEWIVASPVSDSVGIGAEIFVSRKAVQGMSNVLRTYVLINYESNQSIIDKSGKTSSTDQQFTKKAYQK